MASQRWRAAMEHYVGLDVSLKQTSICVVNQAGSIVREGVVDSDPEAIAAFVRSKAPGAVRIGLETGPTATWPASCRPAGLRRCASRTSIATRLGRCWRAERCWSRSSATAQSRFKNPIVRIRLFQILIPQLHFGDFFNMG